MSAAKQTTTIRMPKAMHEKVRELAFERRVSMGNVIRQFIHDGLSRSEQ